MRGFPGPCRAAAARRSLHVLGRVGGAVILFVGDEGGQAAEPDVAQAAVPVVAVGHRGRRSLAGGLHTLVRMRGGRRHRLRGRGWGRAQELGTDVGQVPRRYIVQSTGQGSVSLSLQTA